VKIIEISKNNKPPPFDGGLTFGFNPDGNRFTPNFFVIQMITLFADVKITGVN